MKNKNSQFFIVVVLAIVATILAMQLKNGSSFKSPTPSSSSNQSTNNQQASQSAERRPLPPNLTEDEIALLNPPAPEASKEEKDKHFVIVNKLAKEADILDINKCVKPDPLVLKLKDKQQFKVKNMDSLEHTIVVNQDYTIKIPAGQTITAKANLPYGMGAYGYLCDFQPGVVGFFLVQ